MADIATFVAGTTRERRHIGGDFSVCDNIRVSNTVKHASINSSFFVFGMLLVAEVLTAPNQVINSIAMELVLGCVLKERVMFCQKYEMKRLRGFVFIFSLVLKSGACREYIRGRSGWEITRKHVFSWPGSPPDDRSRPGQSHHACRELVRPLRRVGR